MNTHTPTIEEVKECIQRLMDAGGILPVGETPFESEYFQSTIHRAAILTTIEGVRYWEAREQPLLDGLSHQTKSLDIEDIF